MAASAYDYSGPGLATWPSASYGYGSSSTVYGAHGYRIGKRSAEPFYGYGIGYGVALPTTLENRNNVHGHELASGYAISQPHPGAAGSFQQRTQLHSGYGKRSAEADADAFYGAVATLENRNNLHGHEAHSQYAISQPHPGFAGSYQQVSRLHSGLHYGGYYGKRSAEPHGTGVAFHPTGVSHVGPTTYGSGVLPLHPLHFGKRAAEPQFLPAAPATFSSGSSGYGKRSAEPHGLGVAVHPGLATSFVGRTVHGLPHYGKRDAEAEPEAAPEAAADAEADADAFYGLYGYAAPYGVYGGYGYGWPGGYTSVSGLYGYPYWG